MTRSLPLIVLLLAACGKPAPQQAERSPNSATALAPVEEPAPEQNEFVGVITSRSSQTLIAPFAGPIDRLNAAPGTIVHKGDVIAHIDTTQIDASIKSQQAQEKSGQAQAGAASAQARAAAVGFKGNKRLANMGYGTRSSVEQAQANIDASNAQAGVGAAQAKAARAQVDYLIGQRAKADVQSPIDGVVMAVKVREGETAQDGAALVRVFDPSDLLVRFAVPKEHRAKLSLGQRVQINIEGIDHPVWATVQKINQELQPPMSFTVVEADIDDTKLAAGEIRVAMQARVKLADVPMVPNTLPAQPAQVPAAAQVPAPIPSRG